MDSRGLRYGNDGLRIALRTRRQQARQAAYSWEPGQLLATAEADIVDYLVAAYSVECPVLHPELAVHLPASEVTQGRATIVTAVPFDGDSEIFDLCLSRPFFGRPDAQVESGELRLRWVSRIQASADPARIQAKVRRYFDIQLGRAEKCLAQCRGDIDWHNARLRELVSSVIAERKAGLMADRRLEASLGFPAPPRAEATQFAVPVARRKIETLRRPAASAPSQPEWALPEAQYEQALAVLRNARNALERGPAMTAYLERRSRKSRDTRTIRGRSGPARMASDTTSSCMPQETRTVRSAWPSCPSRCRTETIPVSSDWPAQKMLSVPAAAPAPNQTPRLQCRRFLNPSTRTPRLAWFPSNRGVWLW